MPETMQAGPALLASRESTTSRAAAPREYYVDRLRVAMTAMVILHHTAITYGASGGWFWYELHPSGSVSSTLLTLFCATNQAYFMGFFFLLAGYFTPASLERKGYGSFIADRFMRLGIPLLAFIVFLGPLTAAMAHWFDHRGEFLSVFPYLWQHAIIINGPLWFAQALLMMSLVYCAWRAVAGPRNGTLQRDAAQVPSYWMWLAAAFAVGAAALAIRQFVPTGKNVIGLQLGYFSSYIFLFAVGILAWQHDWLRRLSSRDVKPWLATLVVAWPTLPVAILLANHVNGPGKSNFGGGFSWPAIAYAFWEPFVAWGCITGLVLLFRDRFNQPSKRWEWLGRRAYAVYVIHPPVLVGVALLAHSWAAPALLKFAVIGAAAVAVTWILADPLVRLPGLRRVL